MNNQKVALFDIDYTLFNTTLYRENVYPRLAGKLGYDDDTEFFRITAEIENTLKERDGHFSPESFRQQLIEKTSFSGDASELASIMDETSVFAASLYEEGEAVLEKIGESGVTIGILSTGNEAFQRQKIQHLVHRLADEHIHIFADKITELESVLRRYEDKTVYIIDDLPQVLHKAKEIDERVITIWIRRNQHGSHGMIKEFRPDKTIHSLSEVADIVLSA